MKLVPPGDALYLWMGTESGPTSVVALRTFRLPDGAGRETLDGLYAGMTDPGTVKRSFRRRPYRSAAGNAFGAALCTLGTDLRDPVARLRKIHEQMARTRR